MNALRIIWIALPLFIGFSIYLLPSICRYLALGVAIVSLVYGLKTSSLSAALDFNLLDNFGVILLIDNLSGFFYFNQCFSNFRGYSLLLVQ